PGYRRRLHEPVGVGVEVVVAVVDGEVRRRHGRVADEKLGRGEPRPEEKRKERPGGERDKAREEERVPAEPDEVAEGTGIHGRDSRRGIGGTAMYTFRDRSSTSPGCTRGAALHARALRCPPRCR